jgi:hypothetical protein
MDSKLFELDAKMDALRAKLASFPARITKDFQDRLDISWIFHDHALEGVVLSYSELKAAVDQRIISDVTLIPMYSRGLIPLPARGRAVMLSGRRGPASAARLRSTCNLTVCHPFRRRSGVGECVTRPAAATSGSCLPPRLDVLSRPASTWKRSSGVC